MTLHERKIRNKRNVTVKKKSTTFLGDFCTINPLKPKVFGVIFSLK